MTDLPLSGITSLSNGVELGSMCFYRFTTIRNYITLKLDLTVDGNEIRFTTIRNYITLKLLNNALSRFERFTTIRNYITLKLDDFLQGAIDEIYHYQELHHSQTAKIIIMHRMLDLPLSGITSLSNRVNVSGSSWGDLPLSGITSLSNSIYDSLQMCLDLPLSGITSLSNFLCAFRSVNEIYHYQELHHSQTEVPPAGELDEIYHYQELHHSQTRIIRGKAVLEIYHYQELHHSQTSNPNGFSVLAERYAHHRRCHS